MILKLSILRKIWIRALAMSLLSSYVQRVNVNAFSSNTNNLPNLPPHPRAHSRNSSRRLKNTSSSRYLNPYATAKISPSKFSNQIKNVNHVLKMTSLDPTSEITPNDSSTSKIYSISGILSAISWIATSYIALSYHPDPKFQDCTLRHNILTMTQAFAFPLPILFSCFKVLSILSLKTENDENSVKNMEWNRRAFRRMNFGLSIASFWLAASSAFAPKFAFGYDLYSLPHKVAVTCVHSLTGLFALNQFGQATKSMGIKNSFGEVIQWINNSLWNLGPKGSNGQSALYATGTIGMLYFAIQPIVATYPLATIPTILGKRLSRPASAFTLLGAIIAYTLKDNSEGSKDLGKQRVQNILRKGIGVGSSLHLMLIFLKIIGVDGGGLIFKGRGLWEVYPAMIAVPFAATVSFGVHAILCLAAFSKEE